MLRAMWFPNRMNHAARTHSGGAMTARPVRRRPRMAVKGVVPGLIEVIIYN